MEVKARKLKKEFAKKITVKGIVIPADWDEKGNASAVIISTHDEEEYAVMLNQQGQELLALIREPVRITGLLRNDKPTKIIEVEEYYIEKI